VFAEHVHTSKQRIRILLMKGFDLLAGKEILQQNREMIFSFTNSSLLLIHIFYLNPN